MQVTVEIPESFVAQSIADGQAPTQAVLEAIALEGYRTRRLSEYQIQKMLGLESRFEVHAFLKDHDTCLNYSTEDFDQDMETLRRLEAAQEVNASTSQAK